MSAAKSNPESITRFLSLARRGALPGASSGEKVCHRLVSAIHQIGDDLALLDSQALEGFTSVVHAAAGPWPNDELKSAVFRIIRDAAKPGKPPVEN